MNNALLCFVKFAKMSLFFSKRPLVWHKKIKPRKFRGYDDNVGISIFGLQQLYLRQAYHQFFYPLYRLLFCLLAFR